jgi:hypothetical protein
MTFFCDVRIRYVVQNEIKGEIPDQFQYPNSKNIGQNVPVNNFDSKNCEIGTFVRNLNFNPEIVQSSLRVNSMMNTPKESMNVESPDASCSIQPSIPKRGDFRSNLLFQNFCE